MHALHFPLVVLVELLLPQLLVQLQLLNLLLVAQLVDLYVVLAEHWLVVPTQHL